ncbi:MAG: BatA domain-containing protein [Planctomycetia bacterium]|nr:BatA domain-containing protein [Planctomycetia bacterium]
MTVGSGSLIFEFPWNLWAALACLIPWFFYLRPRHPKVTRVILATLPILSPLIIQHKQNRRRREIFLLILRLLFILFLTFFISRPKLLISNRQWNAKESNLANVVLQNEIKAESRHSKISVLVVDGSDSGSQQFKSPLNVSTFYFPADYIALALNPFQRSFREEKRLVDEKNSDETISDSNPYPFSDKRDLFDVEIMSSYQFSELPLRRLLSFDVLILVDLSFLLEKETEKIESFLSSEKSKGLMIFWGSRTVTNQWNKIFWSRFAPDIEMSDSRSRFPSSNDPETIVSSNHPLLQPFLENSTSGIERLPVFQFFPLSNISVSNEWFEKMSDAPKTNLSESTSPFFRSKRILMTDKQSGFPLLLEWTAFSSKRDSSQSQKKTDNEEPQLSPISRILCWTTCPDFSMSSMALDPVFVPLIQESVSYLSTPSSSIKSCDISQNSDSSVREISLNSFCLFVLIVLLTLDLSCFLIKLSQNSSS